MKTTSDVEVTGQQQPNGGNTSVGSEGRNNSNIDVTDHAKEATVDWPDPLQSEIKNQSKDSSREVGGRGSCTLCSKPVTETINTLRDKLSVDERKNIRVSKRTAKLYPGLKESLLVLTITPYMAHAIPQEALDAVCLDATVRKDIVTTYDKYEILCGSPFVQDDYIARAECMRANNITKLTITNDKSKVRRLGNVGTGTTGTCSARVTMSALRWNNGNYHSATAHSTIWENGVKEIDQDYAGPYDFIVTPGETLTTRTSLLVNNNNDQLYAFGDVHDLLNGGIVTSLQDTCTHCTYVSDLGNTGCT